MTIDATTLQRAREAMLDHAIAWHRTSPKFLAGDPEAVRLAEEMYQLRHSLDPRSDTLDAGEARESRPSTAELLKRYASAQR